MWRGSKESSDFSLALLLKGLFPLLDEASGSAGLVSLGEEDSFSKAVGFDQEVDAGLDVADLPERREGDVVCG